MNKVLILFACLILTCCTPHNSRDLNSYHVYLHTKAPYSVVENRNITPIHYKGCKPVKIWMLIRHGSRLPGHVLIANIIRNLSLIRDEVVNNHKYNGEMKALLKHWQLPTPLTKATEKLLTHMGEIEMLDLAERMQARFPKLLSHIYSNISYKFRFTLSPRTRASARYFAMGLFGRAMNSLVWYPEPQRLDMLLRFYRLCEKWKRQIKDNPNAQTERLRFLDGPVMHRVVQDVSAKLGFNATLHSCKFPPTRKSFKIKIAIKMQHDVRLMYLSCSAESSIRQDKPSPWCSVFSEDAVQIMEYVEDLRYYWKDGYGYDLNHKQACPLTQNMLHFFQRKEEYPKTVAYFTHSGTFLKFLTHLGFFNDTRSLKYDNYEHQAARSWRTSRIGPFGSNLAAVLYQCQDGMQTIPKLGFLHQERPVPMPWCVNAQLCALKHVLNYFKHNVEPCNFSEMCQML